jgi:hypothetical protein
MCVNGHVPRIEQFVERPDVVEVTVREHDCYGLCIAKVLARPSPDADGRSIQAGVDQGPSLIAGDSEHIHEKDPHADDAGRNRVKGNDLVCRNVDFLHGCASSNIHALDSGAVNGIRGGAARKWLT